MKMISSIPTQNKRQVVDITDQVQEFINQQEARIGACLVFVQHTTAAVATVDLDPGTDLDYLDALEALVPHISFRHPHDPGHFPDHLLATLIGASLVVPIEDGELLLGTWQRIVLFEFDGPRERRVAVQILSSKI